MRKSSPYKAERAALTNAIHRCHNERHAAYYNYGARGITVHDDWRGPTGFAKFIEYIGPKPSPELTLERLNNNKGYEPGNVRWATRKEQILNRRSTGPTWKRYAEIRELLAQGMSRKESAAIYGISHTPIVNAIRTANIAPNAGH